MGQCILNPAENKIKRLERQVAKLKEQLQSCEDSKDAAAYARMEEED